MLAGLPAVLGRVAQIEIIVLPQNHLSLFSDPYSALWARLNRLSNSIIKSTSLTSRNLANTIC